MKNGTEAINADWVVTLTYATEPSAGEMDQWEDALADLNALVARVPGHGIDITLHCDDCTFDRALTLARTRSGAVVPDGPIGVTVMTEKEHLRSAATMAVPELMSAAEIAEELGVSRQRVHQLRTHDSFPPPLADLRGGAVWNAQAIRRFARRWERKPGRPVKSVRRSPSRDRVR